MDFSQWSPSHLLVVAITLLAFGAQLIAILTYLKMTAKQHSAEIKQLAERIDSQGETFFHALERLEDRIDKRFVEVNKRIDDTNQQIAGFRTETNQRLSDMQGETNQRLSDIEASIRQLNQNHIDHLTHHER